jgi:short-subunit dehydrogenase
VDLQRYGPWALIIGGSEGVGAEVARQLAADGFKLVLVARKVEPLEMLADELRAGGTVVRTLSADLSRHEAIDRVRTVTDDIEVGLLFYNAGANNTRGNFVELDADVYRSVIGVNVIGQTEFAHHYGALMKVRGSGGIILTGSMAGFMGSPSLATYCGAKAFSRVFSEALWVECQPFGVDVLHYVISFTATPAMHRLGYDLSKAQSCDDVARDALAHIAKGPIKLASGDHNLQIAISRSVVIDRGEAIMRVATPSRESVSRPAPQSA